LVWKTRLFGNSSPIFASSLHRSESSQVRSSITISIDGTSKQRNLPGGWSSPYHCKCYTKVSNHSNSSFVYKIMYLIFVKTERIFNLNEVYGFFFSLFGKAFEQVSVRMPESVTMDCFETAICQVKSTHKDKFLELLISLLTD